jgi:nitrogen fixation protein FixH
MVVTFFAAIFLVNAAMIYAALSTNTGIVANEPYRKGLHYNERIAADARQAHLGWTDLLSVSWDGRITFMLVEKDGRPVSGLRIEGTLGRPSTDRQDIRLTLHEEAPGHYETRIAPLGDGNWLIALDAVTGEASGDPVYRTRKRLWLMR